MFIDFREIIFSWEFQFLDELTINIPNKYFFLTLHLPLITWNDFFFRILQPFRNNACSFTMSFFLGMNKKLNFETQVQKWIILFI